VLVEAYADEFTPGAIKHYPKHLPRSSNPAYFQDMSVWAGDSGGQRRVRLTLPGMAGTIAQLRLSTRRTDSEPASTSAADRSAAYRWTTLRSRACARSRSSPSPLLTSHPPWPTPGRMLLRAISQAQVASCTFCKAASSDSSSAAVNSDLNRSSCFAIRALALRSVF
jgi:hypothetical protein